MSTAELDAWDSMNPLRDKSVSGAISYEIAHFVGKDFIRSRYEVQQLLDCHSTERWSNQQG